MSNLEIVTDAVVVTKYGVLPSQYADFATLRGDASDGLPGVAGIGEKTAAGLLAAHGDLAGILAAAEAGDGMSAGIRAKLSAGLPYLAVAPEVVAVVKRSRSRRPRHAAAAARRECEAGCRGPRRTVGPGHRDDEDHRRARRRLSAGLERPELGPARAAAYSPGSTHRTLRWSDDSQGAAAYDRPHAARDLGRRRAAVPPAARRDALRPGGHRLPHPGARDDRDLGVAARARRRTPH